MEGAIPAIVDKEMFDKCNTLLERYHRSPAAKRDTNFLLTGKLFCGLCGAPMTGDGGTGGNGSVYSYYTCNNRKKHKCDKKRAPKDWIEDAIVVKLTELVHSDDFVNEVADKCMEFQAHELEDSEIPALEARQKEIERSIHNLCVQLSIMGDRPLQSIVKRVDELEIEKKQVEHALALQIISTPQLEREQIVFFLQGFRSGDVEDETYRAFIIETFLNAAYLYDDDRIVLALNYTRGNKEKATFEFVKKLVTEDKNSCSNSRHSVRGV